MPTDCTDVRKLGNAAAGWHPLHEFEPHFLRVCDHLLEVVYRDSQPDLVDKHPLKGPDGYKPVRADD